MSEPTNAAVSAGMPIRRTLLIVLGIPFLAILALLASDSYRQYTSSARASYQTAQLIRSTAAANTAEFLAQTRSLLALLAQRPTVRALSPTHCDALLGESRQLRSAYARVVSFARDGRPVCEGGAAADSGGAPSDAPLPMPLLRGGPSTPGHPKFDPRTGRWTSLLLHPIENSAGEVIGAVGVELDLRQLTLAPSQKDMPPHTVIGLVDNEGVIVARSEQAEARVGRRANTETVAVMRQYREGAVVRGDFQGIQRYFAFTPVPGSDWQLFVALDHAAVLGPVVEQTLWRLALVFVLAIGTGTVALRLARSIAEPVEDLSRTMELVSSGNLTARAPNEGPAELRRVATGLNSMLDARILADAALRLSEARFRAAFQTSPDAVFITRLTDGAYLEANDGGTRMTGWSREELIGKTVHETRIWRNAVDRDLFLLTLQRDGRCENLEADFVVKDGRVMTGLIFAQTMTVNSETCIMSIVRDISARKAAEVQIRDLSFFDVLTGLANRRLFMERLQEAEAAALQRRRQCALIFIDIDDFKTLNETLGHALGDQFLREVSIRLRRCIGESDTAARLGGDEFVVLLENLDEQPEAAARRAEAVGGQILQALNKPLLLAGTEQRRGASLGITVFCCQQEAADEPLKRAELAMQQAKSSGRNVLRFFEPRMQAAVNARATMEVALRQAIDARQLALHYQIQVAADGSVVGAEALLRWPDPRRGMVSPAEFIPLAEATGLILPIGHWVLMKACDELARWADDPVRSSWSMAVNVSAHQFHQADFVHEVRLALQHSGADARQLKLELTEGMLVKNVEDVIAKMNALRAIGVGFSLDDFGTGYSSLAYLKRLPLCQLKIDQAFVRDILIDANDAAIAKMIISLADSMGLTVIAEGVETAAQRDFLMSLGCRHFQGYWFGRPVPADELQAPGLVTGAT